MSSHSVNANSKEWDARNVLCSSVNSWTRIALQGCRPNEINKEFTFNNNKEDKQTQYYTKSERAIEQPTAYLEGTFIYHYTDKSNIK